MRFVFVRHGESTANLIGEFANRGGRHPLTERGRQQAREVARALSGLQVERIYSSPLLRAAQTAQILAEALRAPVETADPLREWDVGMYEGTTDPAGWELHRRVQEDWFLHGRPDSRMPGGESLPEIRGRFVPFIERLAQDGGDADATVCLVGHGGLYQAVLPAVLSNVDNGFVWQQGFPFAACIVAETRPDGLCCVSWGGMPLDPDAGAWKGRRDAGAE